MTLSERYTKVLDYFREKQPIVDTELEYGSVFQLLIAVVLSAQCTDKRVNMITPTLFKAYPDAASMAGADEAEIYEYVRSVSYPNAKARHISQLSRMIMEDYGGEVPQDMDQLLRLPGVGRKTANVIQAVAFGKSAMAVDTHIYRVSHRLGLVPPSCNTPLKVERQLTRHIPAEEIPRAHHWLLLHGRYVCKSLRPQCSVCPFTSFCPKRLEGSKL
ncbi:MAG: endonuclease III [Prevotellaceae bacterium]|nr:endonuclease III [Prevotellaceae bacterium]MDO4931138.1 endonuclease III [Prevotellaceae bacterium]